VVGLVEVLGEDWTDALVWSAIAFADRHLEASEDQEDGVIPILRVFEAAVAIDDVLLESADVIRAVNRLMNGAMVEPRGNVLLASQELRDRFFRASSESSHPSEAITALGPRRPFAARQPYRWTDIESVEAARVQYLELVDLAYERMGFARKYSQYVRDFEAKLERDRN
jgi:hypothetical protein